MIRVGAVLCLVGMVLTFLSLLPLVMDVELPSLFWALSMLVGVGFGLILLGLFRKGRRRARTQLGARAAVD